jgi:hypothetical protein
MKFDELPVKLSIQNERQSQEPGLVRRACTALSRSIRFRWYSHIPRAPATHSESVSLLPAYGTDRSEPQRGDLCTGLEIWGLGTRRAAFGAVMSSGAGKRNVRRQNVASGKSAGAGTPVEAAKSNGTHSPEIVTRRQGPSGILQLIGQRVKVEVQVLETDADVGVFLNSSDKVKYLPMWTKCGPRRGRTIEEFHEAWRSSQIAEISCCPLQNRRGTGEGLSRSPVHAGRALGRLNRRGDRKGNIWPRTLPAVAPRARCEMCHPR